MKIYIGSDHAGFDLKEELKKFLGTLGHEVIDCGPREYDPKDDYPFYILPVAKLVAEDPKHTRGIVLGASGEGEAIAANKIQGIRAAEYYGGTLEIVKLSREHNDANVLSLGAKFLNFEEASKAVKLWLETDFSGETRHIRRNKEIDDLA
ncbi:MAG: RpiB/LacA/LacB family sugar-phosphate isomerase [Candidatus Pacebacteria bacterium]|nr:RpiB/LacA/LacB family sugar-phosphate isomerase [Candidatus Paceibacterota bacterium]